MTQFKIDIYGDKELILYLQKITQEMKPNLKSSLSDIGKHLKSEVKNKFGNYQRGWAKLKRATVIAKYNRRKLFALQNPGISNAINKINKSFSGDAPLVLNGVLRNSIKYKVNTDKMNTVVYSNNPYSAVHEYGYAPKNIPARSYMRLTLWDEEDTIRRIISNRVGIIIGSSKAGGL